MSIRHLSIRALGALALCAAMVAPAAAQNFVTWKANKKGKTMFKIVGPEGASASISGNGVHESGSVPIAANVEDDLFYRITVSWKGKSYTGKFEAQDGKEGIIDIPPSAFDETAEEKAKREKAEKEEEDRHREYERNKGRAKEKPKLGLYDMQPMLEEDFAKHMKQLEKKPDNAGRIVRLKSACKKDKFGVGQMLRVLKLSQDDAEKLDMLRAVRGCVADHSNKGKIAAAFKSNDDKDAAVKILDEQE
jgi:hypothetical protein